MEINILHFSSLVLVLIEIMNLFVQSVFTMENFEGKTVLHLARKKPICYGRGRLGGIQ